MYKQVEDCSGIQRDIVGLHFVILDKSTFWAQDYTGNLHEAAASYHAPTRTIIFGLGYEGVPWVIRHEMLHDLLNRQGEHPVEFFGPLSPCGRLVNSPSDSSRG